MKDKFCNYIKQAKVGDIFFNDDIDALKYVITKIGKKVTYAIEIWGIKEKKSNGIMTIKIR